MDVRKRLEKQIGIEKLIEIAEFTREMMLNKGVTRFTHNQVSIQSISKKMSDEIAAATEGVTNVSGKRFALEASKLYHEIVSHGNETKEAARGQISYSEEDIFEIIESMIDPDIIEDVSHGDALDERNVFAVIKHMERCVVVVLSVGGKRNPNVTLQQVIFFTNEKWASFMQKGMTVREILYGNNRKRVVDTEVIEKIKKIELPWRTMNHRFLCPDVQNASTFSSIYLYYNTNDIKFNRNYTDRSGKFTVGNKRI